MTVTCRLKVFNENDRKSRFSELTVTRGSAEPLPREDSLQAAEAIIIDKPFTYGSDRVMTIRLKGQTTPRPSQGISSGCLLLTAFRTKVVLVPR